MKVYNYKNYEEYVDAQVSANKHKLNQIWVKEDTIATIASKKQIVSNILCHGTRNGAEQKMFQTHFPAANIIGTEISNTATQFSNTIQHDFHEVNNDWINLFDIVYSNSWDHSYDPDKSLEAWKDQLNDDGYLCIEFANVSPKPSDPFFATDEDILKLFNAHGLDLIDTFNTTNNFNGKGGERLSKVYITKRI